jgi:ketosteroid isomerase-like protein
MRQPAIAFTTLLTATLAMTSVVYADEKADKQGIMEAYRAYDAAIERKDVNQVYADYAPEYTLIGQDGKLRNLEQSRQDTQQYFRTVRQINVHNEIKQIQINGQTATVIGTGYTSAIISNPKNPQVSVPFSRVSQYQDIWKRTPGGWKLISTHVLQQNAAGGQQPSQVNRQNLTPAQRQSLDQMEIRRFEQMQESMREMQNMRNCMSGLGYNCGRSIFDP